MCALFLLEAAKRCDKIFGVSPQSKTHTVRDAKSDVEKIRNSLLEKELATEKPDRSSPPVIDPYVAGLNMMTKSDWLKNQLTKIPDTLEQEEENDRVVDLDYELFDINY